METYVLNDESTAKSLIACAQATDEPVVVLDEGLECLIAMRPAVFERILFDCDLLNACPRETLHF